MATHTVRTLDEEDSRFRALLIAAGIELVGIAALAVGFCMFYAHIYSGDRVPGEITMLIGLSVALVSMVVVARHSERLR